MTKEIQETIEDIIKWDSGEYYAPGYNSVETLTKRKADLLKILKILQAHEQAEGELDDEEYLSDKIYATTQYLPLSDKEVAILNGRLAHVINTTKPILAKAILENKEKDKRIKELETNGWEVLNQKSKLEERIEELESERDRILIRENYYKKELQSAELRIKDLGEQRLNDKESILGLNKSCKEAITELHLAKKKIEELGKEVRRLKNEL